MHATKDYLDLPLLFSEYPVRHTINVVPSLLAQIDSYSFGLQDAVQRLCGLHPSEFTNRDRVELARWITTLHRPTQVSPLPALDALWDRLRQGLDSTEQTGLGFNLLDQEWLDAMVLLHLAWTGPISRKRIAIKNLLLRGSGFSHEDLTALLHEHAEIIKSVVPTMAKLESRGQIEISITPYHHPILPLLINSDVARECMPDALLPVPNVQEPADAAWHVWAAIADWQRRSGRQPVGMWPAEGSVSNDALWVMAAAGVRWTATDETLLRNSLGSRWSEAAPYFPYQVNTPSGPISVLFRDHALSDAIGFQYASWDAKDAVAHFMQSLVQRRDLVLRTTPESEHHRAVIPIILDGENCWEFYHGNGELFLRNLMEAIASDERFTSVTCSEAAQWNEPSVDVPHKYRLSSVTAGSWINGSFDVWIGSPTKNLAWTLLAQARECVRKAGDQANLLERIRALQASDYFWWYDEKHIAPHKHEFDKAFRSGLAEIFTLCEQPQPVNLSLTMAELAMNTSHVNVHPVSFAQSTMHDADALTDSIQVETNGNWQRLTMNLHRVPEITEQVTIAISDRHGVERRIGIMQDELLFNTPMHDEGLERVSGVCVRAYLHTSTTWVVSVEEQRKGGRTLRTALTIST